MGALVTKCSCMLHLDSLGLRPVARTSLPFLLMYFAKQEEGNMAGARHGPDSKAHGRIPFMPAHWRHRDNSAVGVGGCTVGEEGSKR